MSYKVNYAREVGENCRLVLFVADNNDIGRPWTIGQVYRRPLREVLQLCARDRLEAAAVTIDDEVSATEHFIQAAKKDRAVNAIDGFINRPWLSYSMQDLMVDPTINSGDNEGTPNSLLWVLKSEGVYVPSSHVSREPGDDRRLRHLFGLPPYYSVSLWDYPFPDPDPDEQTGAVNVLRPFQQLTFSKYHRQRAMVVHQLAPQTFSVLQLAKELGVLRPHLNRRHVANPRHFAAVQPALTGGIGWEWQEGSNHKCCLQGVCNYDLARPTQYCEQVQGGGCSAASDPCQ